MTLEETIKAIFKGEIKEPVIELSISENDVNFSAEGQAARYIALGYMIAKWEQNPEFRKNTKININNEDPELVEDKPSIVKWAES